MSSGVPTRHPLIIVAGPTGSGKSSLAIRIAETTNGIIINCDSMQVYGELRILTARPTREDEARVPHRLYGVLSARERCSVGRWQALAQPEIEHAWQQNKLPIVVGGTGLYQKALLTGLSEIPEVDEGYRSQAEALLANIGLDAFRDALAMLDPDSARRLSPNDRQRLIRAYAVAQATGQTLADWHAAHPPQAHPAIHAAVIALLPPRTELYAALERRFDHMLDEGAIDEVRALIDLDLDPGLPAMKAVGVRELARAVRGDASLEEARLRAHEATRRFAKRQMTWLRHQIAIDLAIDAQYSERFNEDIFSFIRRFLLTVAK